MRDCKCFHTVHNPVLADRSPLKTNMDRHPSLGGADSKPLTTFVHADTRNFREVVQRLTGPSEAETTSEVMVQKGTIGVKKPAFKINERRQYRAKLEITKPIVVSQQFQGELQSPEQRISSPSRSWNSSPMNTPTKSFSNLSLGEREIRGKPASSELDIVEEDRAIKERRYFLHPSPRSKAGSSEPELLNLFPLTSPKPSNES